MFLKTFQFKKLVYLKKLSNNYIRQLAIKYRNGQMLFDGLQNVARDVFSFKTQEIRYILQKMFTVSPKG